MTATVAIKLLIKTGVFLEAAEKSVRLNPKFITEWKDAHTQNALASTALRLTVERWMPEPISSHHISLMCNGVLAFIDDEDIGLVIKKEMEAIQ